MSETPVMVRYITNDVDAAIAFYTKHLAFPVVMHRAEEFAILARGNLRLALNRPGGRGGGGMAMPDGTLPELADRTVLRHPESSCR